ncbi:MAG: glycosyltransferase family 39 protein [Anaerolineae bacterium]|jgi:hypothetical protein
MKWDTRSRAVKEWGAPLVVLLLAFGLRAYGITFGAPFEGFYWWDERAAVLEAADVAADFGPKAIASGLYSLTLSGLYYALSAIQNQTWNPRAIHLLSLSNRILIGRVFTVLAGTALIAVVYAAGRRLAGKVCGLVAALLTAVSPTLVAESRYATTGMHVTLLLYATLLPLSSRSMVRWRRLTLSSIIASLALLTKPNGIIAFCFPLSAGLIEPRRLLRTRREKTWLVAGIGASLLVVLAVGAATLRLTGSRGLLQYLFSASSYARLHRPGASPLEAWRWMLTYELPLLLGGVAGSAFSVARQRRVTGSLQLTAFVVVYSATSFVFGTFFSRWLMVILPGLALLAGSGMSRLGSGNRREWQHWLICAVASLSVAFGAATAWHMGHSLFNDVRVPTWRWVQEHIPTGAHLAVEAHALPVGAPVSTRYRIERLWRAVDHPPTYYEESGFHYVLTADDIYDRWQADPQAHQEGTRAYSDLLDQFKTEARFSGTLLHIPPPIEARVLRVSTAPVYPRGSLVLGEGWWDAEMSESSGVVFRWMTNEGQILYNWPEAGKPARLFSFDAYVFRDKGKLSLLVNDEHVGPLDLGSPGGLKHAEVPVTLSHGLNEIRLISERGCGRPIVFDPDSKDTRCLSIKVANLALSPTR